ncbi:fecCD transport family protein [Anoxybacillus sp. B7M1]|uniref:Iron ABC transporter permease n=1 Tax=Anoxybacteroides rupiense TaxID=311460 RepID=A0ABD5IY84_9BACL|nr:MULTISPECIES: iron ABC transporter permease [Anoxybacillus]ANB58938.1 fecCD transport family protein [Anoxybacillus sp. B2M1]ANB64482.1 fecCD transport family protein [Anoxybacillus sp. B7M1]MBB3908431.1 iron complex transport system permease protein [Anoxybacillus rupiensis]MBS2770933.1 iron ABC transporter permease [Anoxybacillus rupiensis]MDE8563554.1 iron ABC transporter permease [Anoxybacillus rupiensis]
MLKTNYAKGLGLMLACLLLGASMWMSIILGYTNTSWKMAIDAFLHNDGSNEHIVITTVRLPRALIGASVGASLAMAGALMQALTKNPLASPSIFGINAGAGFFIVLVITFFHVSSFQAFTWFAFLGAAIAAVSVFVISASGKEGMTPIKLTLAGTAVAALFSSLTQGMLSANEKALEEVLFWLAGSVSGRKLDMLAAVFPYLSMAWIGAFLLAPKVNVLMLGDDVAAGLGQRINMVKLAAAILVVLLAGGSVAVAGPIGFIGMMVPHIARGVVGTDHRWLLPYCALMGGILLVLADISARYVLMPQEVPVGIMTALIGVPFFIYIARRGILKK